MIGCVNGVFVCARDASKRVFFFRYFPWNFVFVLRNLWAVQPAALSQPAGGTRQWRSARAERAASRGAARCAAMTHHSFRGSFSAVSAQILASKSTFSSIFQDLQEYHLLASKFAKIAIFFRILQKLWENFGNCRKFDNLKFVKISRSFQNYCP